MTANTHSSMILQQVPQQRVSRAAHVVHVEGRRLRGGGAAARAARVLCEALGLE